ncbi:MOSC domain-containing protein [Acidipila sp. EB88]|uniref:MOSC domain-containing protein n=1 Tax=Acidipila sp. EB88 TaxID=2305226 RepID=UPI000F5EE4A7|nr:MOSC domain-containing protein [Acidipila sp. EB88]RRA49219.1 MOSC domain-containing protein [Acidipila sp. EB88]
MAQEAFVAAVFTGQPRLLTDARGTWTSSIFRERTDEPVAVSFSGLAGDKVTQPYHGGAGAALCVHMADHYQFWNARFHMGLKAGAVGENITLAGITEDQVHVGDHVRLGTALVQVSGPRVPCANLARRIGRPDWVKQTIRENRTGFYLRVLQPGTLQCGDQWLLEKRLNRSGSIPSINRCMYLDFDPDFARSMLEMPGLETWWKHQARQKLEARDTHWTATMKEQVDEEQD